MVKRVGSETVLLNLETGQYHGLDDIGSGFLAALTTEPDVEGAVGSLAASYEASPRQLRTDLAAFCRELTERGLIVVEDDAGL